MSFQGNLARLAAIETDGSGINIGGHTNSMYTKMFVRQEALADDASFDLPDKVVGVGIAWTGAEHVLFTVDAAGAVTGVATSAAGVTTDTDLNLCVFDNGTNARVRNRLGSTKTVSCILFYGIT